MPVASQSGHRRFLKPLIYRLMQTGGRNIGRGRALTEMLDNWLKQTALQWKFNPAD